MPWHIDDDHADCSGYAVIKDSDGSVAGCHETRDEAEAQLAALYADEPAARTVAEPERLVREVSFELGGDGRTLETRIVPYNQPTPVVDLPRYGGNGMPYIERWMPGAFEKQTRAANRVEVFMNFEHEDGIRGIIGHGKKLREEPDALYGTFRIHPGADGDKALHMIDEGVLTGLSVEAIPQVSRQSQDGVVNRMKARLDKVALCRGALAAYAGSEVLAVREAPGDEGTEGTAAPVVVTERQRTEVDEALERVGFQSLSGLTVVRLAWDSSPERFTDDEYERSCLIVRAGDDDSKMRCSLPVLEPNGDVNAHALAFAAGRINQVVGASLEQRAAAARKLVRMYRQAGMEPPSNVLQLARRG